MDLSAAKRDLPKEPEQHAQLLDLVQAEIDALVNANAPITVAEATRADAEKALATPSRRCTTAASRPKIQNPTIW